MPKWVNRWLLTALCDNSNYLLTCTLSVTHGSSTVVCPHYSTMSLISWTCQKELPISWPSWCIVVCTVTHLVTSLPSHPSLWRRFPTRSPFRKLTTSRTPLRNWHVRPSGFCNCWSDYLELIIRRTQRSGVQIWVLTLTISLNLSLTIT